MKLRRWLLLFGVSAVFGSAPICYAAPVPNPGTSTVVTNSTTATATYVQNLVTQQVTTFDTVILALLGGNTVYSMEFALPYNSLAVQAAVVAADALLAGDGATYGAPTLAGNVTTVSSMTTSGPQPSLTCVQLSSGAYRASGATNVTSTQQFGPATIAVGDCQQDTFTILPGQLDINVVSDIGYDVPVDLVTTLTSLTTQDYQIVGQPAATPPATSVPEPASVWLVLAGLFAIGGLRRRPPQYRPGSAARLEARWRLYPQVCKTHLWQPRVSGEGS